MSLVYDSFMFYNEVDLLEIRLNELYDVVDKFIIMESEYTFQGKKKPLYYLDNKSRFSSFLDKIIHINATSIPTNNPWMVEETQRNFILNYIQTFKDEDYIIQSDADEIISRNIIQEIKKQNLIKMFCIGLNLYYYNLNCKCITLWKVNIIPVKFYKTTKPSVYRNNAQTNKIDFNGGWHFSYFGGVKSIINKLESYSHTEFNTEHIKNEDRILKIIQEGKDLFDRSDCKFQLVKIDNSYPKYIIDHIEKYKQIGWVKE